MTIKMIVYYNNPINVGYIKDIMESLGCKNIVIHDEPGTRKNITSSFDDILPAEYVMEKIKENCASHLDAEKGESPIELEVV